ncbi:hypothetical protein AcW1_003313 [Taiwanofungus camphoratus]|nr:hypothetical protein AcW1_003313 [Antrodia cinnamomea]
MDASSTDEGNRLEHLCWFSDDEEDLDNGEDKKGDKDKKGSREGEDIAIKIEQQGAANINLLELYVGLQMKEVKMPMPEVCLCPVYTISRAILTDAIFLHFLTIDFSHAQPLTTLHM